MRLLHLRLAAITAAATVVSLSAFAHAEDPAPRSYGDLIIEDPPRARTEDPSGRWTQDVEGALTRGSQRVWVGPAVPAAMPAGFDRYELMKLEAVPGGHLGLYLEPFGTTTAPGCATENMWDNCAAVLRYYGDDGALGWQVDVAAAYPRKDHLVVHHFTYDDGTLYYAEACQTYAKDAKGKCSQVVAMDVTGAEPKLRWRSKPLTSNSDLVVMSPEWLVTGYGFTAERDALYVVSRATGKVATKLALKKAPERIVKRDDGDLDVWIYDAEAPTRIRFISGKRPRLVFAKD